MHYQRGNIRLERVLAIALFVSLMGIFIYRILDIAEISEKIMIEGRVRQFQAALDLHFAELIMTGKQQDALLLEGSNPVTLHLKAFPDQQISGYLGERWDVQIDRIDEGSWIFDTKSNVLIYKLNQNDLVNNKDPQPLRIQWTVSPQVIQENSLTGNGKRTRVDSIKLQTVHAFSWNY